MSDDLKNPSKNGVPWGRIILVISLGLNLLVLGAFIGAHVSNRDPAVRDLQIGIYGRALSRADRRAMFQALRVQRPKTGRGRGELRVQAQQVVVALRADPFDPGAVAQLMQTQRMHLQDMQTIAQDVLVERIEQMSPDQRREFATRLEQILNSR